MILINVDGVLVAATFFTATFLKIKTPYYIHFWQHVVVSISFPTILGLLIRIQKVQVQLRTQEENIIKILKTIKRANIKQIVFNVILFISQISITIGDDGPKLLSLSESSSQAWHIFGLFFEIIFICIFCITMYDVNKQLALFFKQVGIRSYPKKSIKCFLAAYFVIIVQHDTMRIVTYY